MSQEVVNKLIRRNVKAMEAYSSARDEFKKTDTDLVFLDANENPYNTGINRYPDPYQQQLKHKLSALKKVSESNILIGNGSDEILDLIFRAFCEPNRDNCIVLPPTYGMYSVLANLNAVELRSVLLTEDFQLDTEGIIKKINANTKLILLCSPNNPTGNSFDVEKIEYLLKAFEGLIVIDEAYIDFSSNAGFLKRLPEFPNLVITQTLSKAYGAAGLRLGLCYASEAIVSVLHKIKAPYNINVLSQNRALELLNDMTNIQQQIIELKKQRKRLISEFKTIAFIENIYPSDANFVLVKVDDANTRYDQLINLGIVVRNRSNLPLCDNCLRFTIGTPKENDRLLQELKKIDTV